MAIHVVGYRSPVDGKGRPMAIPNEIMKSDFAAESDAIAFIKINAGKGCLFSMTGEADAPSEPAEAAPAPSQAQADPGTIAMSILDYALAQLGNQLTELLSNEWLCSGLDNDDYDSLVIAQNKIVGTVQKLEAGYQHDEEQGGCPLNAPEAEASE